MANRGVDPLTEWVDRGGWVALDTETTGLGPWDVVVEVAAVGADGRLLFESLVAPGRPVPATSTAVHGLRCEDLAGAPAWPHLWPRLETALRGRAVFAWNAAFDLRLIRQSCARHGLSMHLPRFVCLREAFRRRFAYIRGTLDAAALALGLADRAAHRARPDAELARQVALALAALDREPPDA